MSNVRINNEINLTYPDSFKEMGQEELSRYFSSPDNRWGAYDSDQHIILSVSWKKTGFFSFLSDAEMMMVDLESRLHRTLLNYQRISAFHTKLIAKKKSYGIRFEYRVNDARLVQVGDLIVFKHKGKLYAVYYITRKSNAASSRPAFEEVLKSITIS